MCQRSKPLIYGYPGRLVGVGDLTGEEHDPYGPEYRELEAAYLAHPTAFWLRPDRKWLSDEPYVSPPRTLRYYDVVTHQTYEVDCP